jgi:hypothetical protein
MRYETRDAIRCDTMRCDNMYTVHPSIYNAVFPCPLHTPPPSSIRDATPTLTTRAKSAQRFHMLANRLQCNDQGPACESPPLGRPDVKLELKG